MISHLNLLKTFVLAFSLNIDHTLREIFSFSLLEIFLITNTLPKNVNLPLDYRNPETSTSNELAY